MRVLHPVLLWYFLWHKNTRMSFRLLPPLHEKNEDVPMEKWKYYAFEGGYMYANRIYKTDGPFWTIYFSCSYRSCLISLHDHNLPIGMVQCLYLDRYSKRLQQKPDTIKHLVMKQFNLSKLISTIHYFELSWFI